MAYVPGYDYDVFVSYAHADDRDWIIRFADRLAIGLRSLLSPEVTIWIDDKNLRSSRRFDPEIERAIKSSATFLLIPSPNYMQSPYCVKEECRIHSEETVRSRRKRFVAPEFANELFAFRCPILPIEGNVHKRLIGDLTDFVFFEGISTFKMNSRPFKIPFMRLLEQAYDLLLRMRKQSVPVFVYRPQPSPELDESYTLLKNELAAGKYRVGPEQYGDLPSEIAKASLSVFLLGRKFDDNVLDLAHAVRDRNTPWVVWCSPWAGDDQSFLCEDLQKLDWLRISYLDRSQSAVDLKTTILDLLEPNGRPIAPRDKPSVYLVYNPQYQAEARNAYRIRTHFRKEFEFRVPDDPGQHTERLSTSDGVLLVWGQAGKDWCVQQFDLMLKSSRHAESKGLCLFDPEQEKRSAVEPIRRQRPDVYIGEQFGHFDAGRLNPFFDPIRQGGGR